MNSSAARAPAPVTSQKILLAAQRLPSTARTYRLLSSALSDPDVVVTSIVEAVRLDGALSARMIRGANSVIFRRGEPCRSLDDAIVRLGMREVSRLAGAVVAERMYASGLPIYGLEGDTLWLNSLTGALAAEHLANQAGADGRQAYTLGILRPVGRLLVQRLALDLNLPKPDSLAPASVRAWELAQLGESVEQLGGRLLRMWEYPADQDSWLRHVTTPSAHPTRARECALLHVACWAAESLGKGLPFEQGAWKLDQPTLDQAGLRETEVLESLSVIRDTLNRALSTLRG